MRELTEQDYRDAAALLRVDVPAIKAVAEVEARGDGFLADGRVKILFERHKFYKYTGGAKSPFLEHSDICNKKAGGYGAGGAHQYARFSKAFKLDPIAAMLSTSWGKFQVMGFNYEAAGYKSVGEFVDAMKVSEREHLLAFVGFVRANGLVDELRFHRWAAFAEGYNGKDYKKNEYDTKLAAAYQKHHKQSSVSAAAHAVPSDAAGEGQEREGSKSPVAPPAPQNSEASTTLEEAKPADEPVTVQKVAQSLGTKVMAGSVPTGGILSAIGLALLGALKNPYVIGGIIIVSVIGALWFWNESKKRQAGIQSKLIDKAADKDCNTVKIAPPAKAG